jgi:hypothetical protein
MPDQQKIGKFSLLNQGGFVVRMDAQYRTNGNGNWIRTNLTGDILLSQKQSADPGQHNVPDGADVRLFADVEAGNDKIADQIFTYKMGNTHVAKYAISGAVPDPTLALIKRT